MVNFRTPEGISPTTRAGKSSRKRTPPPFCSSGAPFKCRRALMQSTLRKGMITEEKQWKPPACDPHKVSALHMWQRGEW